MQDARYRKMYDNAARGLIDVLMQRTSQNQLLYIADYERGRHVAKMDHLACFSAGMLALGAQGETKQKHMSAAEGIANTCHEMYVRQPTGLAPEYV